MTTVIIFYCCLWNKYELMPQLFMSAIITESTSSRWQSTMGHNPWQRTVEFCDPTVNAGKMRQTPTKCFQVICLLISVCAHNYSCLRSSQSPQAAGRNPWWITNPWQRTIEFCDPTVNVGIWDHHRVHKQYLWHWICLIGYNLNSLT